VSEQRFIEKIRGREDGCQCGAVAFDHVHVGISNEEAERMARENPRVITRVMDDGIKTKDGAA
jgi:hypothetical protein